MIENYVRKRPNLNRLFVLIDARHPAQKIDLAFIDNLYKWEVPFTLIFTKADKEKPGVVKRNYDGFLDILKNQYPFLPEIFITSAEKKQGIQEVLQCIDRYNGLTESIN